MLVILGSGHAGYSLAREWRKAAPEAPLTIITQDDGASYYKPELSKAFAVGKDADAMIKADAAAMRAELKAVIQTHATVTQIDTESRRVCFRTEGSDDAGEQSIAYAKLVLATGASPIRLPLEGDAADQALSINNRQDYAALRGQLTPGCSVLIMGAGLIGCEFANDLATAGYNVTVVDIAAWPLARFVPETCGRALQGALAGLGVTWLLDASVVSLDRGLTARLRDGRTVEADVVISAVGLRPNVHLAEQAGIRCEAGIVVDAHLQTSAPDVYALGDCIAIAERPMPFILPIGHAARALGPTLAGTPTEVTFPAMPTPVKTPVCPTVVCPPPDTAGEWKVQGEAPDLEAVFVDANGHQAGFVVMGKACGRRGALAKETAPPGGVSVV